MYLCICIHFRSADCTHAKYYATVILFGRKESIAKFTLTVTWPCTYTALYPGLLVVFSWAYDAKHREKPGWDAVYMKVHCHMAVSVEFVCERANFVYYNVKRS